MNVYESSISAFALHCNYRRLLSDTTKMTDVKAFTRVHDVASNNLTERLLSQSTKDDEKGLKGGLPFWVIPAIILGTTVTMILMVCMIVSCFVTILFRRKSPNRSLRDSNRYTFHFRYCEDKNLNVW
ncbi:hypothetical protein CHS0354_002259 [Potamilus streckersoni]|uniref:Uncharacterized protein n=1 Tax=Potamilus streckersoni TaxID=2493646 RepID=A0AAE0S4E1_9BIVA|nr:hypothetical protein CHS0354_002259 [Potamilus streckersoni]